jgi:hypothetical protein
VNHFLHQYGEKKVLWTTESAFHSTFKNQMQNLKMKDLPLSVKKIRQHLRVCSTTSTIANHCSNARQKRTTATS